MEKKKRILARKNEFMTILFFLLSVYICMFFTNISCSRKNRPNPQNMNNGYLFDSIEYVRLLNKTCEISQDSNNVNRRYEFSEFVNNRLSEVLTKLGNPIYLEKKELHYGYEKPDWAQGDWVYGVDMHMNSEFIVNEDQFCYRCSIILNVAQSTIIRGVWRDSIRYVELYFLVGDHDTTAFDGIQQTANFRWME